MHPLFLPLEITIDTPIFQEGLSFFLSTNYTDQDLSQVLKEEKMIVIGLCMKVLTYHKKQLPDVQSRLRKYTRIDQKGRLEELRYKP
ncbi:MAG: hypothetical protein P0S93_01380 [Candidatus Neptunochlamydia sp.]|nr:hypothetical protein [Candidatus Neptunochlamydia sp.]